MRKYFLPRGSILLPRCVLDVRFMHQRRRDSLGWLGSLRLRGEHLRPASILLRTRQRVRGLWHLQQPRRDSLGWLGILQLRDEHLRPASILRRNHQRVRGYTTRLLKYRRDVHKPKCLQMRTLSHLLSGSILQQGQRERLLRRPGRINPVPEHRWAVHERHTLCMRYERMHPRAVLQRKFC